MFRGVGQSGRSTKHVDGSEDVVRARGDADGSLHCERNLEGSVLRTSDSLATNAAQGIDLVYVEFAGQDGVITNDLLVEARGDGFSSGQEEGNVARVNFFARVHVDTSVPSDGRRQVDACLTRRLGKGHGSKRTEVYKWGAKDDSESVSRNQLEKKVSRNEIR